MERWGIWKNGIKITQPYTEKEIIMVEEDKSYYGNELQKHTITKLILYFHWCDNRRSDNNKTY